MAGVTLSTFPDQPPTITKLFQQQQLSQFTAQLFRVSPSPDLSMKTCSLLLHMFQTNNMTCILGLSAFAKLMTGGFGSLGQEVLSQPARVMQRDVMEDVLLQCRWVLPDVPVQHLHTTRAKRTMTAGSGLSTLAKTPRAPLRIPPGAFLALSGYYKQCSPVILADGPGERVHAKDLNSSCKTLLRYQLLSLHLPLPERFNGNPTRTNTCMFPAQDLSQSFNFFS